MPTKEELEQALAEATKQIGELRATAAEREHNAVIRGHEDNLALIPVLERNDARAWEVFKHKYRAYENRQQPGTIVRPMRHLFSDEVNMILKFEIDGGLDANSTNAEVIKALDNLHAPVDEFDALNQMQAITMRDAGGLKLENVYSYVSRWQAMLEHLPAAANPPEKLQVRALIAGVKNDKLRERLKARSPDTVDQAIKDLLELSKQLIRLYRQIGTTGPAAEPRHETKVPTASTVKHKHKKVHVKHEKFSPEDRQKAYEARVAKRAAKAAAAGGGGHGGQTTIKCYNCGEQGHLSPQCPKPKKVKTLKPRREEVSNAATKAAETCTAVKPTPAAKQPAEDTLPRVATLLHDARREKQIRVSSLCDTGSVISVLDDETAEYCERNLDCWKQKVRPNVEAANGSTIKLRDYALRINVTAPRCKPREILFYVGQVGEPSLIGGPDLKELGLLKYLAIDDYPWIDNHNRHGAILENPEGLKDFLKLQQFLFLSVALVREAVLFHS